MSGLTIEEEIECLKNLLAEPDDWIGYQLLPLPKAAEESEEAKKEDVRGGDEDAHAAARIRKNSDRNPAAEEIAE